MKKRHGIFLAFLLFPSFSAAFSLFYSSRKQDLYKSKIAEIEKNFASSECEKVISNANDYFNLKPPSEFRKKVYLYLGKCYEKMGYSDKALSVYKIAAALYPHEKEFHKKLADMYFDASFFKKSSEIYLRLIQEYTCRWEITMKLALCYLNLGFYKKAEKHLSQAAELNGYKDRDLLKNYVQCLINLGKYDKALNMANRIPPPDKYVSLARVYIHKGDFRSALEEVEKGEKQFPHKKDLLLYEMLLNFFNEKYYKAYAKAGNFLEKYPFSEAAMTIKIWSGYKIGRKREAQQTFLLLQKKGKGWLKRLSERLNLQER